jgi:serine/threonine protein kinase
MSSFMMPFKAKPCTNDSVILESIKREYIGLGKNCRIEDFELIQTIGIGTFGHVKLGKHKATGKNFAIKVHRKSDVIRLKQVEHVLSEKKLLSLIDHPFITRMPAAFQDAKNLYMVLELVIGGEIFGHLRKAGRFSNETTRIYAAQMVLALSYLHSRDIVYRDLKPENVLLDEKGFIKIVDFGELATLYSLFPVGTCNEDYTKRARYKISRRFAGLASFTSICLLPSLCVKGVPMCLRKLCSAKFWTRFRERGCRQDVDTLRHA